MYFVIALLTPQHYYTASAFLVGALVSILSGTVGMAIATAANYRTTYAAKKSLPLAFKTAYRAGVAMGFALVSLGLFVLLVLILVYKSMLALEAESADSEYFGPLFEAIAGYGLGGSFVALFGRVGGGIYTKAADVGADLVGKVESGLPEDSPKNPATIADNVGDNVGDVAGMSADLFGSFAESTCAALVLSSTSLIGSGDSCAYHISNLMYPISLMAFGLFICIFVSALSTDFMEVDTLDRVERTLKLQLVISTILLLGLLLLVAYLSFPEGFTLGENGLELTIYYPYFCSITGLVSGLFIAASHSYRPVRELADSCRAGAASNVTLGLALGYFSTAIPVIFIALTAYVSNTLMGYYGVSLAALGMLSNLPLSLAIDGYGPISDNAGGIAEMADMGP
jgi:H+-translocating diphosphatase